MSTDSNNPLPPPADPPCAHVRRAADRCYWAVLEVPPRAMRRPGLLPAGLHADMENEVPLPLEDLHIVAAPVDDRRLLVCAVLKNELASIDPRVVSLSPDAVPPELGVTVDPEALNLLVGEFRSPVLRAANRSRQMLLAATFTICALCISWGMYRRAERANQRVVEHARMVDTLLSETTPDRKEQSLTAALEQARELSVIVKRVRPLRDSALDMEALLAAWPVSVANAKPQNLSVTGDGANMAVTVEGDATSFLHASKPPSIYTLDEPRLAAVGTLTRLNLHMRPASGGANSARSTP